MTNDLIERLARIREVMNHNSLLHDPQGVGEAVLIVDEAAAHIEALAERVRELEGLQPPHPDDFIVEGTGQLSLAAIDYLRRARQARKDKENG
jgi:hypothetical protein